MPLAQRRTILVGAVVSVLVTTCLSLWVALAVAVVVVVVAVSLLPTSSLPTPSEVSLRAVAAQAAPVQRLVASGRLSSDPRDLALALVAYCAPNGCLASSLQVVQMLVLCLALAYVPSVETRLYEQTLLCGGRARGAAPPAQTSPRTFARGR